MSLPEPPEGHRWEFVESRLTPGHFDLKLKRGWRTVAKTFVLGDNPKGDYREDVFRRSAERKAREMLADLHNDPEKVSQKLRGWADQMLDEVRQSD